ncbi:hypothetical protein D9M71_603650 [compost metagenome]
MVGIESSGTDLLCISVSMASLRLFDLSLIFSGLPSWMYLSESTSEPQNRHFSRMILLSKPEQLQISDIISSYQFGSKALIATFALSWIFG